MKHARKVLVGLTSTVFVAGLVTIFTPVEAHPRPGSVPPPCESAACDPYCSHWCPNAKKQGNATCLFEGCSPTTGDCTYSAPCGPS
jgi:hypothetical protein